MKRTAQARVGGVALLTVVAIAIILAGCQPEVNKADRTDRPVSADPCEGLKRASFRSTKEHDVGMGPDGPVQGKWVIEFREGTVRFQISDAFETATFTCVDGAIRARAGDRDVVGKYDAAKGLLVFNGVEYEVMK